MPAAASPRVKVPVAPVTSGAAPKETPSLFRREKKPEAKEEVKEVAKPVLEERNSEFSAEKVVEVWEQYKRERREAGSSETEKLVLDRNVEKSGETNIKIWLESPLENSILEKFEADLIRYFRKNLDNSSVQLEREVTEHQTTRALYTSKEKFEYMSKLNPVLKDLKERLGLDFEY